VSQPEGYEVFDQNGNKLVCKLNKSLYGLRQSGRNWNTLLNDLLISQNFVQSMSDSCIYSRINDSSSMIILVWVDDLLICSDNENDLISFKRVLSNRFRMKDLGKLSWFLGIQFEYENDCITMFQSNFISRILDKFSMTESTPRTLPCDIHVNKFDFSDSPPLDDPRIYREIIGSLIYIMTCTRPDLSYVITKLSQYMNNPNQAHLNLARNVLRYLKGSIDERLYFRKSSEPLRIFGFCDSDWGGSEDRKSLSGYCFRLSKDSSLISWKTKKQNVVSLSSCEAEYTSLTFAVCEGKFLSQLFADFYDRDKTIFSLSITKVLLI